MLQLFFLLVVDIYIVYVCHTGLLVMSIKIAVKFSIGYTHIHK